MIEKKRLDQIIHLIFLELQKLNVNIGVRLRLQEIIIEPLKLKNVSWSELVDAIRYLKECDLLIPDQDELSTSYFEFTSKLYDWISQVPSPEFGFRLRE